MRTVASGHELLEAPRPDGDAVWFSDLTGGVWRADPDGQHLVVPKRRMVGGIALHAAGGVVVTGRTVCHVDDGGSRDLLSADGTVFNDMCTDRRGRIWVGASSHVDDADLPQQRAGFIYRLESGGRAAVVGNAIGIPNGMAFSPDESTLYVVDSSTRQILAGALSSDALGPLNVLIDMSQGLPPDFGFPPALPTPDGLAVDEEGGIWVAMLGSGTVDRYTPDGRHDRTITVGHRLVTSLAFGGTDNHDLFITTGRTNGSGGELLTTPAPVRGTPHTATTI